jgi:hypothetical protein
MAACTTTHCTVTFYERIAVNPHDRPRYNGQNLAVYGFEFLEILRCSEGFVVSN